MHEAETTGLALWDAVAGEQAKLAGIAQALDNKASLVKHVREWMKELGRARRFVTADDVQADIEKRGISIRAMGNSMGGIFFTKDWRNSGRPKVKSIRRHSHSNELTVWEYIGV